MKGIVNNYSIAMMALIFCISCQSRESKHYEKASADETTVEASAPFKEEMLSDTIAASSTSTLPIPERKFIRTAELKFKAKDVTNTTEKIEDLTRSYKGFVTHTNLTSSIVGSSSTRISVDTLLERTEYIVENTMTIRVPNTQLDSLLKEISRVAVFIDYRVINADDISLQMLENSLRVKRNMQTGKRYEQAIDSKGKKLYESIQAEDNLLGIQNEADSRAIQNMAFTDQVNYSTVKLNFYQRSNSLQEKITNYENIKVFEPGLSTRLYEAFLIGWEIFEEIIIFLMKIWAIIILGFAGFWLYKKYGIRTAK